MRAAYTLLWHLLLPWLPVRLWWRGRKEPGYRQHVAERFGRYRTRVNMAHANVARVNGAQVNQAPVTVETRAAPVNAARTGITAPVKSPLFWVHAVSLGETNVALPLVRRLRREYPLATVLLTSMTATGRAAGAALDDDHVVQAWLPYDLPRFVRAFLAHFEPVAGMLIETEVWPNLIAAAETQGIPLFLVNARLSAKSTRRYARVKSLTRAALGALTGVAAQSAADASRLAGLGAPAPVITGNLKFDGAVSPEALALGQSLRKRFGTARPVWLAASTREGEEALLLDALAAHPLPGNALTVIVPRHPQRFDAVAQLLAERRLAYVRRSFDAPVGNQVTVVLGDSIGEMTAYCVAADVVMMGGSLKPLGGQNLIEPLAAGKATVVGPHMFNFAEATGSAVAAGAVLQVGNAGEALAAVAALLGDPVRRETMQDAASAFHATHAGAGDRLWTWLAPQLAAALRAKA